MEPLASSTAPGVRRAPETPSQRERRRLYVRSQRVALAVASAAITVFITLLFAWGGYLPARAAAIYTGVVAVLGGPLVP